MGQRARALAVAGAAPYPEGMVTTILLCVSVMILAIAACSKPVGWGVLALSVLALLAAVLQWP